MGFHVGSEILADQEFVIIDAVLKARRPEMVAALEAMRVEVLSEKHNAYYWIRIHTGVEAEHFDAALKGVNNALRFYAGALEPTAGEGLHPRRLPRLRGRPVRFHGGARRGLSLHGPLETHCLVRCPRVPSMLAKGRAEMAKARRTTHRSKAGKKLYAVRDSLGRFKDIQTYERAHRADLARTSSAEVKAKAKKKAARRRPRRRSPRSVRLRRPQYQPMGGSFRLM